MSNVIDSMVDGAIRRMPEHRSRESDNDVNQTNNKASEERSADLLNLTGRAKELQSLQQDMAKSPEFNEARVNELKQAIASGEYQVDTQRIADKLLEVESKLP